MRPPRPVRGLRGGPTRPAPPPAPQQGGFTLLELMVSIGVFVLLAVVLVGLLQAALGTWDAGTSRKDVYERAQTVFTLLTRDLQALYAVDVEGPDDVVYPLFGDADAEGRARIRFVVVKGSIGGAAARLFDPTNRRGGTGGGSVSVSNPEAWEPELVEVAYALDPDPLQAVLWRADRPWDRRGNNSFFDDARFNARAFFPSARGEHIDKGILHWEIQYWTRNTGSWTGPRPRKGVTARVAGPEVRWDATRQYDPLFAFHKPVARDVCLDPVYPEMIRIGIVLEPQVGERTSSFLVAPVDASATEIPVASTRGFAPGPAFARVGKEWVFYQSATPGSIRGSRGARGTKPQPHSAGEPIRTGLTFTTVVYIPMSREGKY